MEIVNVVKSLSVAPKSRQSQKSLSQRTLSQKLSQNQHTENNLNEMTVPRLLNLTAVYNSLMNFIKVVTPNSKSIYISAMKYGRQFLEQFQKNCMPFMDLIFRSDSQNVLQIFKNLQPATRTLQVIFIILFLLFCSILILNTNN